MTAHAETVSHTRPCQTGPQTSEHVLHPPPTNTHTQTSMKTALAPTESCLQQKALVSQRGPGADNQLHQYHQAGCLKEKTWVAEEKDIQTHRILEVTCTGFALQLKISIYQKINQQSSVPVVTLLKISIYQKINQQSAVPVVTLTSSQPPPPTQKQTNPTTNKQRVCMWHMCTCSRWGREQGFEQL